MEVYGRNISTKKSGLVGTVSSPTFFSERYRTLKVSGGFEDHNNPNPMSSNRTNAMLPNYNILRSDISMKLEQKYPTLMADIETSQRWLKEREIEIVIIA